MDDDQFAAFVDESYDWLEKQQAQLQETYDIGSYDAYWYDQEQGVLQFKNNDVVELEFSYVGIGSWNNEKNSYMWAWGNNTVVEERQRESLRIQALAEKTGIALFTTKAFECDEGMAWELAAMAAKELNALGVYRIPHGSLEIFLAIMKPTQSPK